MGEGRGHRGRGDPRASAQGSGRSLRSTSREEFSRGYAQRDPLNEYKSEAFELFNGLVGHLREQVTGQLMRIEVVFQPPEPQGLPPMFAQHLDPITGENELAMPEGVGFGAGPALGHAASSAGAA